MGYRKLVLALALAMIIVALPVAGNDVEPMADTAGPYYLSNNTPTSVIVGTLVDFNVTLEDESGVQDASVEYWHGSGTHTTLALSRTSGNATNGTWAATYVPIGTIVRIRYMFNATDTLGNFRVNGEFSVTITDITNPSVGDATGVLSGKATTGDSFSFWANVSDDVEVRRVQVHYRMGTPPFFQANVTMDPISVDNRGIGLYIHNVTIPSNSTETLLYSLMAWDTSNHFKLIRNQRYVTDNDGPELEKDNSDKTATTGDMFHIEIELKDNVAVELVKVLWGYGAVTPKNETMNPTIVDPDGSGTYTLDVTMPDDFEGNMSYRFSVKDDSDNWNVSAFVNVIVIDNDGPGMGPDLSYPVGEDRFDFIVNVTDNIGVDKVWVEYFFRGDTSNNVTMTPVDIDSGGNGTYGNVGIAVPLDRQVYLEYIIGAMDENGHVSTLAGEYENVDSELPTFGAEGTVDEPVKGLSFSVWIEAADNFDLNEVRVEYRFGAGDIRNDSMEDEGDRWNYTIHIPRAAVGDLTYSFHAVDMKGNWNFTSNRTLTPYNLPPEVGDMSPWQITEGENDVLDLQAFLSDGNDPVTSLVITTEAPDITVSNLRLNAFYDAWLSDHTIEVTVSDGEDITAFTIDITVVNANDLPIFTSEPIKEATVTIAYVYQVTFTDEDVGNTHTFSFDVSPLGMVVDKSGKITWTPKADQEGTHTVDVALDDGYNVVHHQWSIVVAKRPTDDPPAFTNSPPLTHAAGEDYVFDFDAEDPDGDAIEFYLIEGPNEAEMDKATGVLTWDPDADKRDTIENIDFVVRVSDLRHNTDLEFTVALAYPDNEPPEITGSIPDVEATRDTGVNLAQYMSDPDDEKTELKWNATTTSNLVEVHMNGNHLVITPKKDKEGTATVTVKLVDPWGESDSVDIKVNVNTREDGDSALGGSMLYVIIGVVVAVVVVGLLFMMKRKKE